MLKSLRTALAPVGGIQVLIALGAVAWGLGRLQSLAEERQAQLDHLEAHIAARAEELHPSHMAAPSDVEPTEDTHTEEIPS